MKNNRPRSSKKASNRSSSPRSSRSISSLILLTLPAVVAFAGVGYVTYRFIKFGPDDFLKVILTGTQTVVVTATPTVAPIDPIPNTSIKDLERKNKAMFKSEFYDISGAVDNKSLNINKIFEPEELKQVKFVSILRTVLKNERKKLFIG
jgi:hypothetical protein